MYEPHAPPSVQTPMPDALHCGFRRKLMITSPMVVQERRHHRALRHVWPVLPCGHGRQHDDGIIAERGDCFPCHVAGALQGPFIILFQQDSADEPPDIGLQTGIALCPRRQFGRISRGCRVPRAVARWMGQLAKPCRSARPHSLRDGHPGRRSGWWEDPGCALALAKASATRFARFISMLRISCMVPT